MIEEIGTVVAVKGHHIEVQTQIKTTCGSCEANDNCGTGVVARAFAPKQETLHLTCEQPAEVGQQVRLGIPEETLLGASALVYLLPLLVLIVSAVSLSLLFEALLIDSEPLLILGSFAATGISFWVIRKVLAKRPGGQLQPVILGLLPAPSKRIDVVDVSH